MIEVYKNIEGYEELYQISNLGNVKSMPRKVNYRFGKRTLTTKIIKARDNENGYLFVSLKKDGKYKNFKVHRLVAKAFLPNEDNKPCVNHINGNKYDNNIENLEWCTYSENMKHAYKNGLWKPWNSSERKAVL